MASLVVGPAALALILVRRLPVRAPDSDAGAERHLASSAWGRRW
jgi:hypothetical protein